MRFCGNSSTSEVRRPTPRQVRRPHCPLVGGWGGSTCWSRSKRRDWPFLYRQVLYREMPRGCHLRTFYAVATHTLEVVKAANEASSFSGLRTHGGGRGDGGTLPHFSSAGARRNPLSAPLLVSVTAPSLASVTQGLGWTDGAVGRAQALARDSLYSNPGPRVSHPTFATYWLCDLGQAAELLCASSPRGGSQ